MTSEPERAPSRPLHVVPGQVCWILTGGELVEPIEYSDRCSAMARAVQLADRGGSVICLHERDGTSTRIVRSPGETA